MLTCCLPAGAGVILIVPSVKRCYPMRFTLNREDKLERNPQLVQGPMALLSTPDSLTLFQLKIYSITFRKLRSPSWCPLLSEIQTVSQGNPFFHYSDFYQRKPVCL